MNGIGHIASITALVGDPARASMLYAMKYDGLISAGDLASIAGVAASTASEHLGKLKTAGLIDTVGRGRKRYFQLVDDRVAEMLDSMESLSVWLARGFVPEARSDVAMVHGRCCLDHLAGALGGAISNATIARALVANTAEGLDVTAAGEAWLGDFGINVAALRGDPRLFIRFCPDWRHGTAHLGGSMSAALLKAWKARDWLRPGAVKTEVLVTPKGTAGLRESLGIDTRSITGH